MPRVKTERGDVTGAAGSEENLLPGVLNPLQIIPPEELLQAYCQGIFPMANPDTGETGWYREGRMGRGVLSLEEFHVSGRLRRELQKHPFEIRYDTDFQAVIAGCADRDSTWISPDIQASYELLHLLGFAHSVEAWRDDALQGGLYGVALGGAFFGESMFYRAPNASKAALIALVERLRLKHFRLLDIQMVTPLTAQFGARLMPKKEYYRRLQNALGLECTF